MRDHTVCMSGTERKKIMITISTQLLLLLLERTRSSRSAHLCPCYFFSCILPFTHTKKCLHERELLNIETNKATVNTVCEICACAHKEMKNARAKRPECVRRKRVAPEVFVRHRRKEHMYNAPATFTEEGLCMKCVVSHHASSGKRMHCLRYMRVRARTHV